MRTVLLIALASTAWAGAWSDAVEVRHDDNLCLSYRAKLDGENLVVKATIEPGWHTFAMDNKRRAEEKLAGRKSLGIDHPTEIVVSGGLEAAGSWQQSPPKDFSKPDLRWFSWGFEKQALFVVKARRSGSASARLAIRGQACTETTCKNIDVAISVPVAKGAEPAEVQLKDVIPVR